MRNVKGCVFHNCKVPKGVVVSCLLIVCCEVYNFVLATKANFSEGFLEV